jgi:biofilm PGA synthesis N-glycosyltransferase PgaC
MAFSPRVMVGVCAHNEENNIGRLLQNLIFSQNLSKDSKILVICSGCTDKTPEIVKEFQAKDIRIEPIIERVRAGKADAVNRIFKVARDSYDVLVLANADALPKSGSITMLVSKLANTSIGASFAQPVPFEGVHGTCYNIARVIWRLHHIISLSQRPKLSGELCAIRTSLLKDIPKNVATDEPYIELAICKQGYNIFYAPAALVNIRCPTNVTDLLKQRKRIWIGHMQFKNQTSFEVSTSTLGNVVQAVSDLKPAEIVYLLLGTFVEGIAHLRAFIEVSKGKIPYAWEPIASTKT